MAFRRETTEFGMKRGKEKEYSLLGSIKTSPKFAQYQEKIRQFVREYIEKKRPILIKEAMNLVKECQPAGWDPVNPPKQLLKDLKLEVGELLQLSDDDLDKIKAYTAVDSLLDSDFGVDAFLTFEKEGEEEFFITLDLTDNPEKEKSRHINTIVMNGFEELPEPGEKTNPGQENAYFANIGKVAKSTVEQLRSLGY